MITTQRKTPKKPTKKELEVLVAEQQTIIEQQQELLNAQGKNIEDLQLAIDDIILATLSLE